MKKLLPNSLELEIRREFSERLKNFMAQKKWIDDAIGSIVQHEQGKLFGYKLRVKEISSLLKKIEGKIENENNLISTGKMDASDAKWSTATKFSDFESLIDDWVGCRIISYLHDSLIPLHEEIITHKRMKVHRITVHDSADNPKFTDLKINEARDERRLNHNGYIGIHYILEPKPVNPCWDKEPAIYNKFELQTRTILQEAWGQIQHHVIYKGRMPDFIKQERSDAFSGLAGFLAQCDAELARLGKDSQVQNIVNAPKRKPHGFKPRQRSLKFSNGE